MSDKGIAEQIQELVEFGPPRDPPRGCGLVHSIRIQGGYRATIWCKDDMFGLQWELDRPPWAAPGIGTWRWKADKDAAQRTFSLLIMDPAERPEHIRRLLEGAPPPPSGEPDHD